MTSDIPPIPKPVTSDTPPIQSSVVPGMPPHPDLEDGRTARKGGIDSIAMFVILLITLLAFGTRPMTMVGDTTDGRMNMNLLSCLGIAGGIYGVYFLLFRLRRAKKLSTTKKVLGSIGAIGLILHATIAFASPRQPSGGVPQAAMGAPGRSAMGRTGPLEWQIDGRTYHVNSTYYLIVPDGVQYTIEYRYPFDFVNGSMTDEQGIEVAFPLMKYAYQSRVYEDIQVTKFGQGRVLPTIIGVAIFNVADGKASGRKVALSFEEIQQRLDEADQAASGP